MRHEWPALQLNLGWKGKERGCQISVKSDWWGPVHIRLYCGSQRNIHTLSDMQFIQSSIQSLTVRTRCYQGKCMTCMPIENVSDFAYLEINLCPAISPRTLAIRFGSMKVDGRALIWVQLAQDFPLIIQAFNTICNNSGYSCCISVPFVSPAMVLDPMLPCTVSSLVKSF